MFRHRQIPARAILLLAFAASGGVNYAFGLAMGWLLSPGDFGLLAFAQTVGLIAGLILHYGIPTSLAAAIAGAAGPARAALVRGALAANLTLALAMAGAIGSLFVFGPLRPGLETGAIALVVVLSLPFVSLISVVWGTTQGAERFGALAAISVIEILCKAGAGVGLVLLGLGVTGAIGGLLIGSVVGALLSAWYLICRLDIRPYGAVRLPSTRATAPMFGSMLGLVLLLNLDLVGLKLFASDGRMFTGYYQAGIILANAPYYLVTSTIVTVLFTQLSRLSAIPATRDLVGEAIATAALFVVPAAALLVIAPGTILGLFFPSSYLSGAPALRLLAIGNSLLIVVAILTTAFQALGRGKVPASILLVLAAVEPFMLRPAVARWQAIGAASVFVGISSAALLLLGAAYLHALGPRVAKPAVSWFLRYILAASAGVLGVLAGFRVAGNLIAALGFGGLCYIGAAFALRLIARLPGPRDHNTPGSHRPQAALDGKE